MMKKNVLIPRDLLMELIRYHLAGEESGEVMIQRELQKKVEDLAQHEIYTRSLMAETEEERKQYRERYRRNRLI